MTAVAAVLIVGGLLLSIAFVVGTVFFFGMLIHAEVTHAKARRAEQTVSTVEPLLTPARAPQPTRVSA